MSFLGAMVPGGLWVVLVDSKLVVAGSWLVGWSLSGSLYVLADSRLVLAGS